jgi:pimeloyl-ACP methyl ester carboxylesterase
MKLDVAAASGPVAGYAYTGGQPLDPRRPCVVFVHGALHDHSVWTLLARWFANHGHAAIAVDLPGHGRSAGAPLATVEALADWLLAFLDTAGVERAAFVGHSMGSLIALEAAARAPQRASRLVMIGTAYPMAVSTALLDGARADSFAAIDGVNAFTHSTLAAKPSHPGPGTWLHGANRALMRRMQSGQGEVNLFVNDFEVCDRYRGGLEAAARVRCPATLILGERDQMTSTKHTATLAAALHAPTIMLPAGHALMTEAPDALLAALRTALADLPVPATATG